MTVKYTDSPQELTALLQDLLDLNVESRYAFLDVIDRTDDLATQQVFRDIIEKQTECIEKIDAVIRGLDDANATDEPSKADWP